LHGSSSLKYNLFLSSKPEEEEEEGEDKEEDSGVPHPLVTTFNISKDEIPDVPTNRFLSRVRPEVEERPNYEKRAPRPRGKTKSGRIIKGRGTLVDI
jgi:peptidyl-prolyl isomerase G (cyclophilin G)